ncbi:DUF2975 domain-containing protein [Pedobacter rhodius]|uniref:DUF2975 domain-containing protein n=1 Tax=Pedobacter rhodius TaxID=3004098 RepID=A0ABT4KZS7_9SPHI|nr:DUF2975 domain-containing protein [Pedobacter sp. SJ11]MCZ4223348.1 DUF2975 domain-containing protein [Pedobacter sp. SJ11]
MKLIRIISTFLFYIARVFSGGYILTALHVLLSVSLKLSTLEILKTGRFIIYYPFTNKRFLLGSSYTKNYIAEMILLITFYGTFFWLLSDVFKTFRQKKLFTIAGIARLRLFYVTNLIICPLLFYILSLFSVEDYPYLVMVTAHFIMGVFALFIGAIFQQGVNLQKDQDLFI